MAPSQVVLRTSKTKNVPDEALSLGRIPSARKNKLVSASKVRGIRSNRKWKKAFVPFVAAFFLLTGCNSKPQQNQPKIEFTKIPPAGEGGPDKVDRIEGRVIGARSGQQIVLFARSIRWWIQPLDTQPFTKIKPDSTWSSSTYLGTEYAAILVEPGYQPPSTVDQLPQVGNGVVSIAIVKGENLHPQSNKTIQFSGYDWKVRSATSGRGGRVNYYDPSNAWTDGHGYLHLRITKNGDQWSCSEVSLTRSLGYGLYRFVVHDTSRMEPAVVLGLFTWDEGGEEQNHRELDVEISRWGDPLSKNGQFVVQPYYVPANVDRFDAPPGRLTYSFRWKVGGVSFQTTRGTGNKSHAIAAHDFSSAVPTPGNELVHLNLYIYGNAPSPPRNETEVVIEKFEFLP